METYGIGRPSTYATIVSSIVDREYISRTALPSRKTIEVNLETINLDLSVKIRRVASG